MLLVINNHQSPDNNIYLEENEKTRRQNDFSHLQIVYLLKTFTIVKKSNNHNCYNIIFFTNTLKKKKIFQKREKELAEKKFF